MSQGQDSHNKNTFLTNGIYQGYIRYITDYHFSDACGNQRLDQVGYVGLP